MKRTFKERLLKMLDIYNNPMSREDILYNGVKNAVNNSIKYYNKSLNQLCSFITQYNYSRVIKTMNKINKRASKKNKETKDGNK